MGPLSITDRSHTEQQLLTEIMDLLLGEPATASNAHSTAWTLSSCTLRPRKKLSDKQKAKGFVSQRQYDSLYYSVVIDFKLSPLLLLR